MKKRSNNNIGYESASTIDNPPRDEPENGELFESKSSEESIIEDLTSEPSLQNFDIELTLKLKKGKAYSIPLLTGNFGAERVYELLTLALNSRRNKQVIDAILDLPEKVATLKLAMV